MPCTPLVDAEWCRSNANIQQEDKRTSWKWMDMDGYGWIIAWISTQAPISSSTPCFGLLCTTWRWARHSLTKGHDGALGLGWYLDESSGRFRIFVQQQGLAMVTKGPSSLLGNVNFWYDDDISCGKVSDNTHTQSAILSSKTSSPYNLSWLQHWKIEKDKGPKAGSLHKYLGF